MARLPLLWLDQAKNGERGAGIEAMREIAHRLRNHPTSAELEAAACLFDRVGAMGPDHAAAALYLTHAHAPRNAAAQFEVWEAVYELISDGKTQAQAFSAVAKKSGLTESRVKATFLKWRRAHAEHQAIE